MPVELPNNGVLLNETFGARLRRVAAKAKSGNPLTLPPWNALPAFPASTQLSVGRMFSNAGGRYSVAQPTGPTILGTTGATGPTHKNGQQIISGGVTLNYFGGDQGTTDSLAPTMTVSASVPSTTLNQFAPAGAQSVPGTLRLLGARIIDSSDLVSGVAWNPRTFETGLGIGRNRSPRILCEVFDDIFTLVVTSNTPGQQVIIDGRYFSLDGLPLVSSTRYYTFDLSKLPGISHEVEMVGLSQKQTFGGLYVSSNGQVRPPTQTDIIRGVLVGDSQEGVTWVSANVAGGSFPEMLGTFTGIRDMHSFSIGGTGWTNSNGGFLTYRQRIPEILTLSPDAVIFDGSTNDLGADPSAITAEVTGALSDLRSGGFKKLIMTLGVISKSSTAMAATEAAIAAGVAAFNDPRDMSFFIPYYADPALPLISGTHNNTLALAPVRAKTTSTNEARFMSDDDTHLTDLGNYMRAAWVAAQYRALVLPKIP